MQMEADNRIGGKLKRHYKFWLRICKDKQILKDISGAKILFIEGVKLVQKKSMLLRQNKMNEVETKFVDNEIEKLLKTECITEISEPLPNGWTSNIFLVKKKDGGYRLILNLKPLNKLIKYQKFKMDNIKNLVKMLRPLDWLSSMDIKSVYPHIKVKLSFFAVQVEKQIFLLQQFAFWHCQWPYFVCKSNKRYYELPQKEFH